MLLARTVSLALVATLAICSAGCGDGGGGDTTGSGGSAGSGGTTSTATGGTGGTGGSGGTTTSTAGSGGTGGTTSMGGGGTGGAPGPMVLTSPDITEGGMIPDKFTCAGINISPELDWTPGPPGTLSYSIIFKDNNNGLIHSAIWDIPKDTLSLPENVDKTKNPADVPGAQQSKAYDNFTYGYLGPCPGGNEHTYVFTLYALDVAILPLAGVGTKESASDLSIEHQLASATLSAKSAAKP